MYKVVIESHIITPIQWELNGLLNITQVLGLIIYDKNLDDINYEYTLHNEYHEIIEPFTLIRDIVPCQNDDIIYLIMTRQKVQKLSKRLVNSIRNLIH